MWSTFYEIRPDESFARSIPIGKSISASQAFILDKENRHVPPSVIGELALGGDGVARGYTDDALTRQSFIDIIVGGNHHRVYKTGDRARWNAIDGNIEFLGRLDNQVKLRGQRIELGTFCFDRLLDDSDILLSPSGEVDQTLRQHSAVEDVVTILHTDPQGEKRLVSFVILKRSSIASITFVHLRKYVASLLPSYMVPSIQLVAEFPLTTATKVDRKALARLFDSAQFEPTGEDEDSYIQPAGSIEETVSAIFHRFLSGPRISALDE